MLPKNILFFFVLLFFKFLCSFPTYSSSIENCSNNPESKCYDVVHYRLEIEFQIEQKSINGYNEILFKTNHNTSTIQIDLDDKLILDSLVHKNQKLKTTHFKNYYFIHFPIELVKNEYHQVIAYYHGKPKEATNPPWEGGIVWKKDSLNNPWVGIACEGIGASCWMPCKNDLSDKPDSVRCKFIVPRELKCISNGVLENTIQLANNRTGFIWKTNYPISHYNITFYIGKYEHFYDTISYDADSLVLDFYVLDYHKRIAQNHFKQTANIIKTYEFYFGKYPFIKDGYAVVESPYLGMEHQSAIAYGNNFKNDNLIDFIILHETAHEWWGNHVAADDYAEMWIQESFATYSEWLFYEKNYGKRTAIDYALNQKKLIKNQTPMLGKREICYPSLDNLDIYYKGAWMLHTIRSIVSNDSLWFALLKSIQKTFSLKNINTEILLNHIDDFLKIPVSSIIKYYLNHINIPIILVKTTPLSNSRWRINYKILLKKNENIVFPIDVFINNKTTKINCEKTFQEIIINSEKKPTVYFSEKNYLITLISN
ncbi:MAG: M1 family peptidase [Cytophagales bacterium]|nr:MAG: M1 family peptidase [Cytophagales bacterium]